MAVNQTGEGRVGRGITDHVYVDVDGTLLLWPAKTGGARPEEVAAAYRKVGAMARGEALSAEDEALAPKVNEELVGELKAWADRRDGTIVIWTTGGRGHAELAMMLCGLDMDYRVVCIAKPDLIIDDASHGKLFARIRSVLPHEFKAPT